MSDRFDYLHQDEREWLRAVRRRSAVRRTRLLAAVVLVIALALSLLASRGSRELRLPAPVPAGPTAEQRAVEDGQRALDSWGRFAVTNDLRQLRDYFWPNGPQYQDLLRLARLRSHQRPLGPPPYRFVLSHALVLAPSMDHRILQGRVQVSRPGEKMQSYRWNVWMRRDTTSGGRWRLWTIEDTARAPTRSRSDPVVVAAGDIAPPGTGWGHGATSDRILAIDPTVVLTLGDNQYPSGTLSDFQRHYGPTWGRFRTRTRPSPGNHDYETAGAAGYFAYFGRLAKPRGRSDYSFDLGTWHVVAVNSAPAGAIGEEQLDRVRSALERSNCRCELAYWHHPRYSSGAVEGHDPNPDLGPLWRLLNRHGVDVVLNGHAHHYERFAPLDAEGRLDESAGIREFVVGTGGGTPHPFEDEPVAGSRVRITDVHGVLELVLEPNAYTWRFVSAEGRVLDHGAGACHP